MKRNFRTYLILLGLIIAFLLFYTSGFSNASSPKFSYSLKPATESVYSEFTSQVGSTVGNFIGR